LLHVLAILYYLRRKKDNLIEPMIHGDKVVGHDAVSSRDDTTSRVAALVVLAMSCALVYWLVSLGG
jgi:hypothetical protein